MVIFVIINHINKKKKKNFNNSGEKISSQKGGEISEKLFFQIQFPLTSFL
mgnify:CR=1 FL=1